jgi:hypothetical protein
MLLYSDERVCICKAKHAAYNGLSRVEVSVPNMFFVCRLNRKNVAICKGGKTFYRTQEYPWMLIFSVNFSVGF